CNPEQRERTICTASDKKTWRPLRLGNNQTSPFSQLVTKFHTKAYTPNAQPAPATFCREATGPYKAQRTSITNEIVTVRRTTLRRPAAQAPIVDKSQIAHDGLETLRLADPLIGRMPEPCCGNRLKIIAPHFVFVEIQYAFRRS